MHNLSLVDQCKFEPKFKVTVSNDIETILGSTVLCIPFLATFVPFGLFKDSYTGVNLIFLNI